MYIIAIFLIAVMTIISQFQIQSYLSDQLLDSNVINVAGRQRMLSQKITKLSLMLVHGEKGRQTRHDLRLSLDQWKKAHFGLMKGSFSSNKNFQNSEEVLALFEDLKNYFDQMYASAEKLLKESNRKEPDQDFMEAQLEIIAQNEFSFLNLMDQIVNTYDREAFLKVNYLKKLEYVLLGIVLVTLCLEAFFIFRPAGRRFKRLFNELSQSELSATNTAGKLNALNEELKETVRQNRDIQFALRKATVFITTDEKGNIKYSNDRYCSITKYREHELIGKQLFFNNQGGEESIIYEHIRNPKLRNKVWQGEVLDQAKDGANFWLDVTMIPIENAQGELYQYLVICSDITPRKETELELAKLNESKLNAQKRQQRFISNAIITGQEKERKRMAVEIHDCVGQQLTALKFEMEALKPETDDQKSDYGRIQNLIYDIIKETRRISSNILPTALNDFGLGPSIKELVKSIQKSSPMDIEFTDELKLGRRLNKNIEIALYRITQEAMNNALKHSNASHIQIKLSNDAENLNLIIKDDGIGFDPEKKNAKGRSPLGGNGMMNMQERSELINANLKLESLPNLGVIVSVQLPLTEEVYG